VSTPWIVATIALWLLVGVLAVFVLGLVRQIIPLLEATRTQLASLPSGVDIPAASPGSKIPSVRLREFGGGEVELKELLGTPAMFLFLSSNCVPCEQLAADLRRHPLPTDLTLFAITDEASADMGLGSHVSVLIQTNGAASKAFMNGAAPQAFLLDADGIVITHTVPGSVEDLHDLARAARVAGDLPALLSMTSQ
jgi:hypothetical protein